MEVVDDIRALEAQLDQGYFDEVAQALRTRFISAWDSASQEAAREALEVLYSGQGGSFTEGDLALILDVLGDYLGDGFAGQVEPAVRLGATAAYEGGQLTLGISEVFSPTDRRAQRWLRQHHMYWVRTHYDRHVRERIRDTGLEVLGEGLGRFEAGQRFSERLGRELGQSETYWELMSNHVTTRSRSFGRIEGFEKAGVEWAMIDAVLDRRTSCQCKHLDGKVIPVSGLVEQRDALMQAEEPEAVKEISPWLSCARIEQLNTPEELAAAGIAGPPYHPFCRSRLVMARPEEVENAKA